MDSDDDLPALELVSDGDGDGDDMPALERISNDELLPPPTSLNADWDDDNMPSLMSVSDSSEDQDEFDDDNNSNWEDEDDDADEDDDLPPLEPLPGARPFTITIDNNDEDLSDMPPLMPVAPSHQQPRQTDPSWLPPRTSPIPEELPNFFNNITRMRTMLDVLHLGPSPASPIPSGHIPREVLEHIMMHSMLEPTEPRSLEPDPERAKVLVRGLDTVPEGLLTRMFRVGGAPGAHEDLSGDDESGMAGCAVCWAPLLDQNVKDAGLDDDQPLPFASEAEENRVVSLPCAHVFHSGCLIPWFSRPDTTTCPTCRFDIDPDALTWKSPTQPGASSSGHRTHGNEAPADDWEDETDVDDDEYLDEDEEEEDESMFPESIADFDNLFFNNIFTGGGFRRPGSHPRAPRGTWTLPEAPGKTLRERIMEKERDLGLRCVDVNCVLAPTDEYPSPGDSDIQQISIQTTEANACKHMLHPTCLVMSARVSGRAPEDDTISPVEVSCPFCRVVGSVSKEDWDAGVKALAGSDC